MKHTYIPTLNAVGMLCRGLMGERDKPKSSKGILSGVDWFVPTPDPGPIRYEFVAHKSDSNKDKLTIQAGKYVITATPVSDQIEEYGLELNFSGAGCESIFAIMICLSFWDAMRTQMHIRDGQHRLSATDARETLARLNGGVSIHDVTRSIINSALAF